MHKQLGLFKYAVLMQTFLNKCARLARAPDLQNLEADALRGARLREVVGDADLDLVLPRGELAERDRAREGNAREVSRRVGRELARGGRNDRLEIGRASCRERVYIAVVGGGLNGQTSG